MGGEWEGERGRGRVTHVSCDGYIYFLGGVCVSQFGFFLMSDFFYRAWNVSIRMNALCPLPPLLHEKSGEKEEEKKKGKEDLRFIALSVLICLIPVDDMLLLFFFSFSFLLGLMLKNRVLVCATELLLNGRRTGGFGETVRI